MGFSSDVANGITWAVDNGAKVVNLSVGGPADAAELSAVQYADSHDVVVVAAGGNDGTNGPASYPAAYSTSQGNVIAVAASGTTPFTVSCLNEAKRRGALTIGVANNRDTPIL